jgi:hypothetical protein
MRQAHASTAVFSFVGRARRAFNGVTPRRRGHRSIDMTSTHLTDRIRHIDLAAARLLVLDDSPGTRIQVLSGGLWITEESNLEDRFAAAGQWLRLEAPGRTVVEALGPSRVRLFEPTSRTGAGWRAALQRWRPRAHTLALRSLAVVLALLIGIGLPEMAARSLHDTQARADAAAATVTAVAPARTPG